MSRALRRPSTWALVVVAFIFVIFLRRWIHHAQLESIPVIVPQNIAAADVVRPPAARVANRMLRDLRDLVHPPSYPRLAVLTFDDGPLPVTTPLLLAQLNALHVPATFFAIGRDMEAQPAISLRAQSAGIEWGDHTQTHPEMPELSDAQQEREIRIGAATIAAVSGSQPRYFRPPHGAYDARTIEASRRAGIVMILWDVDPGDWRSLPSEEVANLVVRYARSPAVILLHNGRLATIEALPTIVRAYRNAGFQFVTLAQLQARLSLDAINDPVRVAL